MKFEQKKKASEKGTGEFLLSEWTAAGTCISFLLPVTERVNGRCGGCLRLAALVLLCYEMRFGYAPDWLQEPLIRKVQYPSSAGFLGS